MITVAVIGLGYFSQFHLSSWTRMRDVSVVGVTDLDPSRRDWAASTYAVTAHETVEVLLAQDPDVIDIVAPPSAHASLLRTVMAKGRTIICQKPFCTSLEEGKALAREAAQCGARVVIHENFRFQPWYRAIKAFLDTGDFGNVFSAKFSLRPGDGRGPDAYLSRQPAFQTMDRFLVHETAVHFLDVFRWLFGGVRSVYADLRQLNPVIAGEDAGYVILEHENGVRSVFDGNRLSDHVTDQPRRTMGEMTIEGDGGTLSLNGQGRVWLRPFGETTGTALPLSYPVDDASFGGGCVHALNQHVVAGLQGEGPFENEVHDYLTVMALSDVTYASHAAIISDTAVSNSLKCCDWRCCLKATSEA